MKNVVQFSGGKDSTAMLLLLLERGVTVDEIIFCDTGMEFPELYRHIEKVKEYIDRPITVLKPEHNCQSKGFDFGGLYERFRRLGCWCCPLQRLDSLRTLRRYYPELWQELLRLDAKAPYTFFKRYSAADLEEKFALEEAQGKLF